MAEKITIVGGKSTKGRITIQSDEFRSRARCDNTENIICEVKRLPRLSRFLLKKKCLPIPRIVRTILFLVDGMTIRGKMFVAFYIASVITANKFIPKDAPLPPYAWTIYAILFIASIIYINRKIAPWHGAEHMAIAAYEKRATADLAAIVKESPVHEKCGGRLVLPAICGLAIASLVSHGLAMSSFILSLLVWECVLWVDTLKGWNKVPGFSHASFFLQKYVTTRKPGERELRTAQRALQELIAAHRFTN